MRKTARPVVWEGGGAQSPSPDPITRPSWLEARRTELAEAATKGGGFVGESACPRRHECRCGSVEKPPRCSGPGALPKSVETSLDAADTSVCATLPRQGFMHFGGPPRPMETGTSARATKLRATRSMVIRTAENQSTSPFKADRILPCGGLGGFQPPDRRQKTIVCPTGLVKWPNSHRMVAGCEGCELS
jgi:hypothetical protein